MSGSNRIAFTRSAVLLAILAVSGVAEAAPMSAPAFGWTWWSVPSYGSAGSLGTDYVSNGGSSASPAMADAYINFGDGTYPQADAIASGNPRPWYESASVAKVFGGTPDVAQRAAFEGEVLRRVENAFSQSGVTVNLTADPTVSASHTLSVVSGASSIPFPGSIGTTAIGGDGFSFIDAIAPLTHGVGQLEQVVANNVAHELMLSFGVPENYDKSGKFIDATNADWGMMTSPDAVFSPEAAQAINDALGARAATGLPDSLPQFVSPEPVPEPLSFFVWGVGLVALVSAKRIRKVGTRGV